jgi:hypothetical protein
VPEPGRELRRSLRAALEALEGGLRVLAEDFLGLEDAVDLVAADRARRLVVVLAADPGRELEAVARALAQCEFLGPRVADWKKLQRELPLDPEAGSRALVLAREFPAPARLAARALGGRIGLARCLPTARPGEPLRLELVEGRPGGEAAREAPSAFRFGLSDEDLGLTPEERVELAG